MCEIAAYFIILPSVFCPITLMCVVFVSHFVYVSLGVGQNIKGKFHVEFHVEAHFSVAFSSPRCCPSNSITFSSPEV